MEVSTQNIVDGKNKKLPPDVFRENQHFRSKELSIIRSAIKDQKSVLIVGQKNTGKSSLMTFLSSEDFPNEENYIDLQLTWNEEETIEDAQNRLATQKDPNRRILFIDELERLYFMEPEEKNNVIDYFLKLKQEGVVLIMAAKNEPSKLDEVDDRINDLYETKVDLLPIEQN